jgi:hypothetical protein
MLCGGDGDPDVFFFNTQLMQQYWTTNPPTTPVTVLNVDTATPSGTYAAYQTVFGVLKTAVAVAAVAGGATDGGALAVLEDYHAGLVPPMCLGAVKAFFDAQL